MIPKLVRDLIPAHMEARGCSHSIVYASKDAMHAWLLKKLQEEVAEVLSASNPREIQEECADVLEVLLALVGEVNVKSGVSISAAEKLESLRAAKFEKNGGFSDGVILLDFDGC